VVGSRDCWPSSSCTRTPAPTSVSRTRPSCRRPGSGSQCGRRAAAACQVRPELAPALGVGAGGGRVPCVAAHESEALRGTDGGGQLLHDNVTRRLAVSQGAAWATSRSSDEGPGWKAPTMGVREGVVLNTCVDTLSLRVPALEARHRPADETFDQHPYPRASWSKGRPHGSSGRSPTT
jgi:hypothetical protein